MVPYSISLSLSCSLWILFDSSSSTPLSLVLTSLSLYTEVTFCICGIRATDSLPFHCDSKREKKNILLVNDYCSFSIPSKERGRTPSEYEDDGGTNGVNSTRASVHENRYDRVMRLLREEELQSEDSQEKSTGIQAPMRQDDGIKKGLPYENGSEEVASNICKEVSFAFVSSEVGDDKFMAIQDDGGSLLSTQEYVDIKEAMEMTKPNGRND